MGGLTNDYTIIVNFNDSVTVGGNPQAELIAGSGTVGSGGTPNGGMVTVSGNTVTIPLTNVTNQQVIQVRLNGVNGASFIIPMGVLVGDTNGDGSVNASDIGQTKAQSGNAVTGSNFREDVNGRRQHQRQRYWAGEIEIGHEPAVAVVSLGTSRLCTRRHLSSVMAINLRTHFGGGTITGVPANYVVSVDYAFNGTDSLGRVGTAAERCRYRTATFMPENNDESDAKMFDPVLDGP